MQNQTRNLVIVALIAALVVVACWNQSPGQDERAKAATLEYHVVPANKETLNAFAEKGWEVCGAFSDGELRAGSGTINPHAILRRTKAAK